MLLRRRIALLILFSTAPLFSAGRIVLYDQWTIRPASEVQESGDTLSQTGFQDRGWRWTAVPSTVSNKVYPEPYFGKNLRDLPGTAYPLGANLAHISTPRKVRSAASGPDKGEIDGK